MIVFYSSGISVNESFHAQISENKTKKVPPRFLCLSRTRSAPASPCASGFAISTGVALLTPSSPERSPSHSRSIFAQMPK